MVSISSSGESIFHNSRYSLGWKGVIFREIVMASSEERSFLSGWYSLAWENVVFRMVGIASSMV